jgi:hypothetical protein
MIQIELVKTKEGAEKLKSLGFCPIEASFGEFSVVDDLKMDHHSNLSRLEAVSIRAYRDYYGARLSDPRFVMAQPVDEDATFAAASLAGILPGDNPRILALAETIAKVDTEPVIGLLRLPRLQEGHTSLAWRGKGRPAFNNEDAVSATLFWRKLLDGSAESKKIIALAKIEQAKRDEKARELLQANGEEIGRQLLFINNADPGLFAFHIWCGYKGGNANNITSWRYPIALCRYTNGIATIAVPSRKIAEKILGKGGLKNVFPLLPPKDGEHWGGREAVGGGPRSGGLAKEDCIQAAVKILDYLLKKS